MSDKQDTTPAAQSVADADSPARVVRVLIVDDDFLVARVHTRFVEQVEGFEVVGVAHNGAQTVEVAADTLPDLILLDVHLPDQTGIAVLRGLREIGVSADVLIVTAERDAEVVQQARAHGAIGYLVKPFSQVELRERLADVRRARGHLSELSEREAPEQADIDRVFGAYSTSGRADLPKGLNTETADLVLTVLDRGETTASECAEALGLSRVTARRYLEHFVAIGAASARQQYGKVGRPQRCYART